MRHAESQANAGGIMAGHELETPLTEAGKAQAQKAGVFLKDTGIQLVMVSPMERTRQTASIIAKELGLDKSKLVESRLVIERGFGEYSGKSYEEYLNAIKDGTLDQSQLEPAEELFDRVAQAFAWLDARPEDTMLVVSHGATGRMFRLVDQKLSHKDFHKIERFGNAEIDKFTI